MIALLRRKVTIAAACAGIMACTASCTDDNLGGNRQEADRLYFGVSVADKWGSGTATRSSESHRSARCEARLFDDSNLWLLTSTEAGIDSTVFLKSGVQTRGTTVSTSSFYSSFGVYAYVYDKDATWSTATSVAPYINNVSVSETDDIWYPSTTYFWPGSDYKMAFFGYAPNDGNSNLTIDCPGSSLTYTVAGEVKDQKDLVLASATDVDGNKKETLDLTFKHILTAVKVKAASGFPGTITKVELQNVYGSGTYVSLTDASNTSLTKTWDYTDADGNTVAGTSGEVMSYSVAIDSYSGTSADTDGTTEVLGDGNGTTFFMIPQTLGTDAKLVVTLSDNSTLEASLSGKVWPEGYTVTYIVSTSSIVEEPIFEVTAPTSFTYLGGTNSYSVLSYVKQVRNETDESQVAVSWTAEFVEGDEVSGYTVIERPDWITSFVTSGEGSTEAVSYDAGVGAQEGVMSDPNATLRKTASINTTYNPYNLSNSQGASMVENTANCYIINAPGTYSLPLVYGNAIKDGSDNKAAYVSTASTSSGRILTPFVNHLDRGITDPYIYNNKDGNGHSCISPWQYNHVIQRS
ncbi:MAG: fimbrillin family protein [Bacteroides sp.]|nr:fimbrillin family protein [Bacteroides sp.]